MGFSTSVFLFLFLPIFLLLFWICRSKYKSCILLFFSLLFYLWGSPKSLLVLSASAIGNYFLGLLTGRQAQSARSKRACLLAGLLLNFAPLLYYKYTDFFLTNINRLLQSAFPLRSLIAPIGISYFTFSAVSYLMDVYRGTIPPERNFFKFYLYMILFQKVTAGPIVRYADISAQLDCSQTSLKTSADGARRFCIGLAKKVLIADQLGKIADEIFSLSPSNQLSVTLWLGVICYTLQIYHDFSGYSDMAIGLGKLCGLDFKENFNYPYISKSITEFWRRWHISLSSWFRDYLYIPLGGNRRGNVYVNLFIAFLATGLWHGSSWHFIAWGIWNGIFILAERFLKKHTSFSLPAFIHIPYTLIVVSLGWVFFRCDSLHTGILYFRRLLGIGTVQAGFSLNWYLSPKLILVITAGILCCIPWKEFFKNRTHFRSALLSYLLCLLLLVCSIATVMSNTYSSFIYFKF